MKRIKAVMLLLMCFLMFTANRVQLSADDRPICHVTIEQYPGEGAHFYFWRVADADENMEFTLTDVMQKYNTQVIPGDINDESTWIETADALTAYVYGDEIDYTNDGIIVDGKCEFVLEPGLYLLLSDPVEYDGWVYESVPMLVSAPQPGYEVSQRIEYLYDFSVQVKQLRHKPKLETLEYKVLKQWKDGSGENRPKEILVNILKNGEIEKEITLSQDNDWCYKWEAVDDGSVYKVQEKDIPEGYQVKTEERETTFIICNILPDVPNTRDETDLSLPLAGLCIGGVTALAAGLLLLEDKKRSAE